MSTPGHGLVLASGPDDPRILDVDDDFRSVLVRVAGLVAYADRHRARLLHPRSTGARGTLRVVDSPGFGDHAFFRPGREFPVVVRYSNSQGADDRDVAIRGMTLRLASDPDDPTASLLDLTLTTGECFFARDAETFALLTAGTTEERDRLLANDPRIRATLWDGERVPASFATYELHSQTPRAFVTADGTPWLARFRVCPAGEPPVPGHFDPQGRWWPPNPPDGITPPGATGSPTGLRDELDARVATTGVDLLFQVRLHPLGDDPAAAERALDASRPWPGDGVWHDVGHLRLDQPLSGADADALAFDPACAPPELGIALSRSPYTTASVNHLRAIVYRMASAARRGEPVPEDRAALLHPVTGAVPGRRTVCVIGAGPAGLAAARELERGGHRVVVLEQAGRVGGKAASTVVDGRPYDLGALICTGRYHRLAALAAELGVPPERIPPERTLTVGESGRTAADMSFFTDGSVVRYESLRAREFPRIGEPGLAHSAAALSAPLSSWLDEHGLRSMFATFGLGWTSSGYGYPDEDLPALYFVKYCEMTGLLPGRGPAGGDVPPRWTVTGGFGAFWEKVAASLGDLRTGTTVESVTRDDDGVLVRTDRGDILADDLLLAVPLDQVVHALDATDAERDLADRVRHRRYRTTVATAPGLPRGAFHLLGASAEDSSRRGDCVGFGHRYPDTDVVTCWSYVDSADPSGRVPAQRLERDLTACGASGVIEHRHRDWAFLPHFGSDDVAAGVLEELEYGQGGRRTYLTGGLAGFELVECAVAHAQDLVRRSFTGPAAAAGPAGRPVTRSAGEIREWLRTEIAGELNLPVTAVDPEAALSGYALDSLALAWLMTRLSTYVGHRVPHTVLLQLPTIDAVAGHLSGRVSAAPVTRWQASVSRSFDAGTTPLFCVGGIGAPGVYLGPLAAALAPDVPLYPFEIPGRSDGVGEPCDDVEELAAGFVAQVRSLVPDGPYRLGGHSFGGVVAYEMGRQLRAIGHEVTPVTLLDSFVPVPGMPLPEEDLHALLAHQVLVRHMTCLVQGRCDCGVDPERPLAGQRAAVARALGAVDPDRYDEHIASVIEVQLASIHAYADYAFGPSDLTVHLVRTDDGFAPMAAEDFGLRIHLDSPSNGWEYVDVGELRVFPVSGNHFSMFTEPHVREVTHAVRAAVPGS